jgi:hypothetical protein
MAQHADARVLQQVLAGWPWQAASVQHSAACMSVQEQQPRAAGSGPHVQGQRQIDAAGVQLAVCFSCAVHAAGRAHTAGAVSEHRGVGVTASCMGASGRACVGVEGAQRSGQHRACVAFWGQTQLQLPAQRGMWEVVH